MGFQNVARTILSPPPQSRLPTQSSWIAPSTFVRQSGTNPTVLFSKAALIDQSKDAIQFFTSIRIPAALIAGSSLGALFVLMDRSNRPEREKSKRELTALFFYHALSMASLLLSLNVIVTATSASNTMLIGNYNPVASSPYEFLTREVNFEYVTTRWSFYASLICFLKAVIFRSLLEFDLLRKERLRSAVLVVSLVTGFGSHVLHIVNDCLYSYPNIFQMTVGVIKLYYERVVTKKSPMLIMSSISWILSVGLFASLLPKLFGYVKDAPSHDSLEAKDRQN